MVTNDDERLRLAIPVTEALAFALGHSDLGYAYPDDVMRKLIGVLALDALEYSEEWRSAAVARAHLTEKWPECFST